MSEFKRSIAGCLGALSGMMRSFMPDEADRQRSVQRASSDDAALRWKIEAPLLMSWFANMIAFGTA